MNALIKPMLASDYDPTKVNFPVVVQAKIDGVRGLNLNGTFTARSLKPFDNKTITAKFSKQEFTGLDGEITYGDIRSKDLCRNTTSLVNTQEGHADVKWNVFDYVTSETINLPYLRRLEALREALNKLYSDLPHTRDIIVPVESKLVYNLEELEAFDTQMLKEGYEGTILRDPNGLYKSGRSTAKEGGLLRIKRFVQEDAIVLDIIEAVENTNEAKINELGLSERSSHKSNLIPKGMIGTLICRCLKTDKVIKVGPGKLTEEEKIYYFLNPELIIGVRISYKFFPKGIKDKPRFPTFEHFRVDVDTPLEGDEDHVEKVREVITSLGYNFYEKHNVVEQETVKTTHDFVIFVNEDLKLIVDIDSTNKSLNQLRKEVAAAWGYRHLLLTKPTIHYGNLRKLLEVTINRLKEY